MYKYIVKRLLLLIPILLGVTFIVFSIMSLTPGNPARLMLGISATNEAVEQLNHDMGYDRPYMVRYVDYVKNALTGDFGNSYRTGKPVNVEIIKRFPTTLKLAIFGVLASVMLGIPLGILSAVKQYTAIDMISTISAIFMASVPNFWLGLMMIILFSLKLEWLPSNGIGSIYHYIMPTITLAIPAAAGILRLTRSMMLETIRQDYVRTARSKGATEKMVIWKHSLKNALLPIITIVGMNFGYLLGGTILIETIFSMPGIGSLMITAIRMKDIPQVMATVILLATLFSLIMLMVDLIYAYIDPRIKARYIR